MSRLTRAGIIYLSLALTAAVSVLGATLGLYIAWSVSVPVTFSAAVVNTAATLAAATFVGVFDMFFTIQQMRQNEENQRRWREELEKERAEAQKERAEAQKARAEANARLEELLVDAQAEREQARVEREQARVEREQSQQVIADLLARNLELNARLIELLERRNGNGQS
ncbi:MAG: hypothetical protein J4G13_05160 [Dehalococcoidia bacterium]|nr:hypothetical protein [Dehalococcoidia bacterium]